MRRTTLFACLIIWLGFSSTVASAWFFASMWHGIGGYGSNRLSWWSGGYEGKCNGWTLYARTGPGKETTFAYPILASRMLEDKRYAENIDELNAIAMPAWSVVKSRPHDVADFPPGDDYMPTIMQDARGWPVPSLHCTWVLEHKPFRTPRDQVRAGIPIAPWMGPWVIENRGGGGAVCGPSSDYEREDLRALPLAPTWPGFVISAGFWCAAWGILLIAPALPFQFIRARRARKGRCVRCGYSIAHSNALQCSECGWSVGKRVYMPRHHIFSAASVFALLVPGIAVGIAWHGVATFDQLSPMQLAARRNDADAIRSLVAQGVSPDETSQRIPSTRFGPPTPRDATPLMWAAAHGSVEAIHALLEGGAALPDEDMYIDGSALWVAIQAHQNDAFHALLAAHDFDPADESDSRFESMVWHAASAGTPVMVRTLIDRIENRAHHRAFNTALREAASAGNVETTRVLIDAGADVNGEWVDSWDDRHELEGGWGSPLRAAVEHCQCDAAELLLDSGALLHGAEWPALNAVLECEDVRLLHRLVDAGLLETPNSIARLSPENDPPIHHAIFHNNFELANALVNVGIDARLASPATGQSLLFSLCWEQQDHIAEWLDLLLSQGLDINHKDYAGNTALMLQAHDRNRSLVRALLNAGADPTLRNHAGHAAVDFAEHNLTVEGHESGYGARGPDHELAAELRNAMRAATSSE